MKAALLIALVFPWLNAPLIGATCKGEDPCKACRDCSRCAYCTSGKGSCGVVRDQNGAQQAARDAKRKKAGK